MEPMDIMALEQRARALRAAEMRRLEKITARRLRAYAVRVGSAVVALAKAATQSLRHLFSWHPQRHA